MPQSIKFIRVFLLVLVLPTVGLAANQAKQVCNKKRIPESTPASRFSDPGDGTVTDNVTGLMWKKCSEGRKGSNCQGGKAAKYGWQQALKQAQTLNQNGGFAGYSDWRVPNVKELRSIVEERCYSPSINRSVFPATESELFWSATPYANKDNKAWSVYFLYGSANRNAKTRSYQLRLVRGGL